MRLLSCRPPRSVSGLVWVSGPLHCGTGRVSGVLVWVQVFFGVFRIIFFLVLPIPPHSGAGGDLDKIGNAYWGARDRLTFFVYCSLFRRHSRSSPLAGGMAMAFVGDLSLSPMTRPSLLSFFFGVTYWLRNVALGG